MTNAIEAPEAGVEHLPVALTKDKLSAFIELAEKIDTYVAAQNKIRTAVLKAALPGDFVQFGKDEKAKVELGGPGSERIATLVGLSVTGLKHEKIEFEDKHGKGFTWIYTGDVALGGRMIEQVEGRASSRDLFFGFENGAWKELSNVKESDVRTAARRGLYKEGVKIMLGLRGLPADPEFLKSIGLDPTKVKKVEFRETKASGERFSVYAKVKNVGQKKTKTEKIVYVIQLSTGQSPETFSESMAKAAKEFKNVDALTKVAMTPTNYSPKLESIEAAPEGAKEGPVPTEQPAAAKTETGDAQEA